MVVEIEDIVMLTMLFPTRIVTSKRWGSSLRDLIARAPRLPSSIIASIWWADKENSAISDDEKKPDPMRSNRIIQIPITVNAICPSSTPTTGTVYSVILASDAAVNTDDVINIVHF
jgi:hypothetical protein